MHRDAEISACWVTQHMWLCWTLCCCMLLLTVIVNPI